MNDLLKHPWVRALLIATTVAMCSWALRETATITLPIVSALGDVLVPVAIGFCIAYVLVPVVDVLHQRWHLPRFIAAGVPFLLFLGVLVLGTMLVVPTVIRQTSTLATRLLQGEPFKDLNHNGRWDPDESYTDLNGNGRYDAQGMLASGLAKLQERMDRLHRYARPELDHGALGFLDLYRNETAPERALIAEALAVARDGRAPERWPEALRREPAPEAPAAWAAAWPGATRAEVDEAYARLPQGTNTRWLRNLASAGQALAAKHAELLTALRAVRNAQAAVGEPEAERVRQALAVRPGDDDLRLTKALAAQLDQEAAAENPAARELLAELRGEAAVSGRSWLAPMIESIETSIQGELKAMPLRLGNWAKTSISFKELFGFGLDTVLVPIYAFFLILAMAQIRRQVRAHLPRWKRDQVLRIVHDIELVVAAFFRGRLLVCLFCAVLTYLGFTIIGFLGTPVPYAALFAILIGLATAIPFAGILFLVPAVLLTLLEGGSGATAWALVGVYAVVQGLETFLLTPTIMGRETELHPVTLIIAMLLCGKLLGVLGVILAVPIAATCRILAREFLWPRVRQWAGLGGGASDRLDARPPAAP